MAHEMHTDFELILLKATQTSAGTAVTSATLDFANIDGALIFGGYITGHADNNVSLQNSDNDSSYAAISGSSQCDATKINFFYSIHKPKKRYLQVVQARAGANSVTAPMIALVYGRRHKKTDQGSTTIAAKHLVEP